jgi:cation diffusion facilitator family transporter
MLNSSVDSYRVGEKGAKFGILVNTLLFAAKLFAGIFGRSQAMIADAFHTAGDAFTSAGVLLGFRRAGQPADAHHPFGHGRAESIVAKLVGLVLIVTGAAIAYSSVRMLIGGRGSEPGMIALVAAVVSIIVKEVAYRRVIGWSREINSSSLEGDAWHHRSDALSSIAAFAGIIAARMGMVFMDPLAGIIVGGLIIKVGVGVFHRAYDELMDAAPPEELKELISSSVLEVEGVKEVKSIMVRKAGIDLYLEVIIGVNGSKTVIEAHNITISIKKSIVGRVRNVKDIVVHVEPLGPSDR